MRFWRRSNNRIDPVNNDDSDSDESSSSSESAFAVTESEISYSIESFNAVATPVAITMIASALVVVFINTDETRELGEELYASTYQILNVSDDQSASQNIGNSLVNTLVIVSVICVLTFVVVLCYKFKCMKFFYAYMVLVTATLLGFFTSQILLLAFAIYSITVDKLSLAFILYNYAAVGTLAIFLPRGFPKWVPQGYLIAGSVCMAWQLSFFNVWMTWTLLVMLALYDLFAVLSPCGPLKALANLISGEGAPGLPGMIYEANLPQGVERRSRNGQSSSRASAEGQRAENHTASTTINRNDQRESSNREQQARQQRRASHLRRPINRSEQDGSIRSLGPEHPQHNNEQNRRGTPISLTGPNSIDMSNKGKIPLVLARMFELSVLDKRGVLTDGDVSSLEQAIYYTEEEVREMDWTPQQLSTVVTCIFPPRGGRIAKAKSREQKYSAGTAYIVYGRSGNQQRKLVVTPTGSVKEVLRRETSGEGNNNDTTDDRPNSIKLGIGDFIFYSLLVSRAALHSFTAFASCLLVVLSGLAATLVILAIKGQALPALPISIFLGVIAFLLTTTFLEPWIEDFTAQSIYV